MHSIEALKSGFGFCRCTNEETFINKRRAKRNNIELILYFGMKIAQIGGKQRRELLGPECSDELLGTGVQQNARHFLSNH